MNFVTRATFLNLFFTGLITSQLHAQIPDSAKLSGVSSTGASVDTEVSFVPGSFDQGLTDEQRNAIQTSVWWSGQELSYSLTQDLIRFLNENTPSIYEDWSGVNALVTYSLAKRRSATGITADIIAWDWSIWSWALRPNVTIDPADTSHLYPNDIHWVIPTGGPLPPTEPTVLKVTETYFVSDDGGGTSSFFVTVSGARAGYSYQLSRSLDLKEFVDVGEPTEKPLWDDTEIIVLSHQFPKGSMDAAFFRVTETVQAE